MLTGLSLRHTIVLVLLGMMLVLAGIISWLSVLLAQQHGNAQLIETEREVLQLLAHIVRPSLARGKVQSLQGSLAQFSHSPQILQITVSNSKGETLLRVKNAEYQTEKGGYLSNLAFEWKSEEVRYKKRLLGHVHVQFLQASFLASLQKADVWVFGITGIAFLCILLAGLFGAKLISRRLNLLSDAAERIAGGDLNVQINVRGNDEIARLGRAFAKMVKELQGHLGALTESEQRFELAVAGSNDSLWDWDVPSGRMYLSPRFGEMLDFPEDQVPGLFHAWLRLVYSADRQRVEEELNNYLELGKPFQSEFRIATGSNNIRWVLCRGQAVRNELAKPVRVAGSFTDITQQKEASLHLKETLDRLQVLIESLPDEVVFKDGAGRWQVINSIGMQSLNLDEEYWMDLTDLELANHYNVSQKHFLAGHQNDIKAWESGKRCDLIEKRMDLQGYIHVFEVTRVPLFHEGGDRRGLVMISRDVTDRKRAEEALFKEKERAQVTLQSIGDGVITTDVQGLVEYMNPIAERLTGWEGTHAVGKALPSIFNTVEEESRASLGNPLESVLQKGAIVELPDTTLLISSMGEEYFINVSVAPIRSRRGTIIGAVLVFHDITERRELMQRLSYQATHDALTGLINRYEFERRLQQVLQNGDSKLPCILCFMDLDQFKIINDTCGHAAGDELLRRLAELLQSKIRKQDTLARLGGDEFALLLEECPLERARVIAENLRHAVNDFRYAWEDKTFAPSVSIGLVPVMEDSKDIAEVLSAADEACFLAKDQGRNRVQVSLPDDDELKRRRGEMQWVTRLKRVLDETEQVEDRFVLFAQPIVGLEAGQEAYKHYEILIRIRDKDNNIISPGAFLPAAERYGLISALDAWVVKNAIQALATQCKKGEKAFLDTCSVNLSGASLGEKSMLDLIRNLLQEHNLPAELLCFEITETVAIANFNQAMHFIHELKKLGCRFSLDDFGSGFSSFSYLKTLPVDYLKIDGSFVRHMVQDPNDAAMVEAINQIGQVMGLKTIAEFVGDQATLDALKKLGVDYGQGFFLGKPGPLADICRGN